MDVYIVCQAFWIRYEILSWYGITSQYSTSFFLSSYIAIAPWNIHTVQAEKS